MDTSYGHWYSKCSLMHHIHTLSNNISLLICFLLDLIKKYVKRGPKHPIGNHTTVISYASSNTEHNVPTKKDTQLSK